MSKGVRKGKRGRRGEGRVHGTASRQRCFDSRFVTLLRLKSICHGRVCSLSCYGSLVSCSCYPSFACPSGSWVLVDTLLRLCGVSLVHSFPFFSILPLIHPCIRPVLSRPIFLLFFSCFILLHLYLHSSSHFLFLFHASRAQIRLLFLLQPPHPPPHPHPPPVRTLAV